MSGCTQTLFRAVEGGDKKNSNTLCGANIQSQFPLIIWHSLFQVGGIFVKPSMSSLTLVNILSFKLHGFLHYLCNVWKVNRRLSGILVSLLLWAPQAISSRKPSRTSFVLQCQSASRVSDLDNENRSQRCLSPNGEVSWFFHFPSRNWDVCRIIYKIKIQWLGWLLSDLSKSSVVTIWRKAFHHPHRRATAGSHRRRRKEISARFPSRQVCPGWRPEFRSCCPLEKPGGGWCLSLGKKCPRWASQSHIPPQDLPLTSLSSATLRFLASLTPIHRFSFSSCFTNSAPSYVCCLSKWLINHGCRDAQPARIHCYLLAAGIRESNSHLRIRSPC